MLRFLESLGRPSETQFYVRLFRQLPKESFAIIVPGSAVLRQAAGALVEQLKFLADLGLFAPIVLGLFDSNSSVSNGERLAKRLPTAGLDPCVHDVDEPDLAARVASELRAERIPIIHIRGPHAETIDDRFSRLGRLAADLESRKVVLLRRRGGLSAQAGRTIDLGPGHVLTARSGGISVINLRTDRDSLLASKKLRKEDADLLERVDRLLLGRCNNLLVSVASPLTLLKELFTVKGAGTLLKRGTPIERFVAYSELDVTRLTALLRASFERDLAVDFFSRNPLSIYLESSYRGAAILESAKIAPFLTKFAVEPEAQGEGIGQDLWQALTRDERALFWRARPDNPINGWYVSLCDGMARSPNWHVFWRGIEPQRIPDVIAEAHARPVDFVNLVGTGPERDLE